MILNYFNNISRNTDIANVVIIAGQSNSDSKAVIDENISYPVTNSHIKIYVKPDLTSNDNGNWESYNCISGNNINVQNRDLGERWYCEVASIGQLFYNNYGQDLYVIKVAKGSTYLENLAGGYDSDNRNFHPNALNNYFKILTQYYITPAITNLITNKLKPSIKYISWHQGESDGLNSIYSLNYQSNLALFINSLRAYRPELSKLKLIISRVQDMSGTFPYIGNVRTAQDAFCRYNVSQSGIVTDTGYGNDLSYSIDIDDLPTKDGVHLSSIGQDIKGNRIYDLYNSII